MIDRSFQFQLLLTKYFDGGWLSRSDGLLSALFSDYIFQKNSAKISAAFQTKKLLPAIDVEQKISIPAYDGSNPGVLAMVQALKPLQSDLLAAFLHGSLATGEEISYSDFDGVLIIRDEVFHDRRRLTKLAKDVYATRKIMHDIDPLQHHGWFVLTERDLQSYPLAYLPIEVLQHAKSLLPFSEFEFPVRLMQNPDYYTPVKSLCRRIRRMTQTSHRPQTLYQLKSLLSEFMLLPALYIQARDRRGIFKKFGFLIAAADFSVSAWSIMDEVSQMRAEWPDLTTRKDAAKVKNIGYIWIQYRKRSGPAIPEAFKERLNNDFYKRMAELANQVEVNLFR